MTPVRPADIECVTGAAGTRALPAPVETMALPAPLTCCLSNGQRPCFTIIVVGGEGTRTSLRFTLRLADSYRRSRLVGPLPARQSP